MIVQLLISRWQRSIQLGINYLSRLNWFTLFIEEEQQIVVGNVMLIRPDQMAQPEIVQLNNNNNNCY